MRYEKWELEKPLTMKNWKQHVAKVCRDMEFNNKQIAGFIERTIALHPSCEDPVILNNASLRLAWELL